MTLLLSLLARLLGPILPFVAVWVAAKQSARLAAKNRTLETAVKAMRDRERIEDDVQADPDLACRARRSVLRKSGK